MAKEKKQEGARSFAVFIKDVADGDVNAELSAKLNALVSELTELADEYSVNAKGVLTLKLAISIDKKGVMGIDVDATPKLVTKRKRPTAQAWATPGGNVTFINPRQLSLGVREVPRDADAEEESDDGERRHVREV